MDFRSKSVEEVLVWLERKGYDEWVREIFEENEVDGQAFLLLTKKNMKELVNRVGPRVKLIHEQAAIRKLSLKSSVHNVTRDTEPEEVITDDNYGNEDIDDDDGNIDSIDNRDIASDDNRNDNIDDGDEDDVIFVAEYNGTSFCEKEERIEQNSVMEFDSPIVYNMLTVEEPSQLSSDTLYNPPEGISQNDNSAVFSNGMYSDDGFEDAFFPSEMSSDDDNNDDDDQMTQRNTKVIASAALQQPDLELPEQLQADTSWNHEDNETSKLMNDHCTVEGLEELNKESEMESSCTYRKEMAHSSIPWPFPLPTQFPQFVSKELSTGNLSAISRSRLVFTVASAVFKYASYPTREEYDHVARQIVKKYKFMADSKGSHEYIIKLLKDKLVYLRSVKTRKRNKCQSTGRNKCQSTSRKNSFPVYCPISPALLRSPGHDNSLATYARNAKVLQEEEAKPSPNKEVVMDLMKKTFFNRRNNTLKASTSIVTMLKTFPSLKNYSQIIAEFSRIMGKDMQAAYNDAWNTLMQNVLKVAVMEINNIPVQSAIKLAGQNPPDGHKSILTLYCLCYLLRKIRYKADHQYIMTFIPEHVDVRLAVGQVITEDPNIVVRGNIVQVKDAFLVVENEVICEIPSMTDAVLVLLASYYVFNKTHDGGHTDLFIFLEHSIMGRHVPVSKTRVHNFLGQLAHVNAKNHTS